MIESIHAVVACGRWSYYCFPLLYHIFLASIASLPSDQPSTLLASPFSASGNFNNNWRLFQPMRPSHQLIISDLRTHRMSCRDGLPTYTFSRSQLNPSQVDEDRETRTTSSCIPYYYNSFPHGSLQTAFRGRMLGLLMEETWHLPSLFTSCMLSRDCAGSSLRYTCSNKDPAVLFDDQAGVADSRVRYMGRRYCCMECSVTDGTLFCTPLLVGTIRC
jgi:hypothetical protein